MDGGAALRSETQPKGVCTMRFMSFVKSAEVQGAPPQALMDAMGQFMGPYLQAGTLIDAGGLAPTSMSTRIRIAGGQITVLDGPFSETKEVVGGYAIMELSS